MKAGTKARRLSRDEKRTMAILGLPSFGLALSVTVVVTFAPLLARRFTDSTTIVGALIATEGLVALFLPVLAGTWSDHLRTRLNGRLPFLIIGLPLSALALVFIALAGSLWELIVLLTLFFIAYYLAYEPYRALYPDLIDDHAAGRAQSVQAMWRGVGTGVALGIGGFLFAVARWLPFIFSAVLVLVSTGLFLYILLRYHGVPKQTHHMPSTVKESYVQALRTVRRNRELRRFMVANGLWELTLAALKSFILLYLTVGLGKSKTEAAAFVTIGAVIMFLATPFSGKLGDHYGKVRVSRLAAVVFGLGLLVPAFTTNPWLILPVMPVAAFGGAIVLTLPYAILMPMMSEGQYGRYTGLYSTSRGIGIMLGPLLAGAVISLTRNVLPAHGYSAMWLVCAAAMLLSFVPLRSIESVKSD